MKTEIINSRTWKKAVATNSTATSYASKIPTKDTPSGDGVHDISGDETLEVLPYCIDGNNDTFGVKVIGWREVRASSSVAPLWIPNEIATLACVAGNVAGLASSAVLNTEFFADTITATTGTVVIPTVTADTPQRALMDITGYKFIEFTWDLSGAQEAVSMNALICSY